MKNTNRVQAIDRAVAILRLFGDTRRELKLTEIADALDLNKSTVHGILSTMKYHGMISQDEETQKYRLGLYLMELGSKVANSLDIIIIAEPYLRTLRDEVEETVHLGTLDKLEVVYIGKMESNQSMRIASAVGARNPAHSTGIGKALLAYLDEAFLEELLPEKMAKFTPYTITDKKQLLDELAQIRRRGYAFDLEENNLGLKCISAPIYSYGGKVRYSISVSGPTVRMTEEKTQLVIRLIKEASSNISAKLGHDIIWE